MKKIFAFMLVIAILIPLSACAETPSNFTVCKFSFDIPFLTDCAFDYNDGSVNVLVKLLIDGEMRDDSMMVVYLPQEEADDGEELQRISAPNKDVTLLNDLFGTVNGITCRRELVLSDGVYNSMLFARKENRLLIVYLRLKEDDYARQERMMDVIIASLAFHSESGESEDDITWKAQEAPMVFQTDSNYDISNLSYEELTALKDQLNKAMWESEEWQEVEVPQGLYTIGEDIPEGKWTIKAADEVRAYVIWGDKLDASGVGLSWSGDVYKDEHIYSVSYQYYEKGKTTEVTWDLKEGQYFIVDDGIALFTPYNGKPSLGFK